MLSLLLVEDISAGEWSRFRGADGNASAPEAQVPVEWSDNQNILWKSEIPGYGSSSPVTFQGRIYLTSFTGYGLDPDEPGNREDLTLHVLCFDESDGGLLWDRSFPADANEQTATRRVADHGYATGTAAVDEAGVYAYFGVSGLIAFTHDGEKMWHVKTGSETAGFGSAASPTLYQDLVIINASIESKTVFAFDRQSGEQVWKIEDIERSWTTPVIGQSASGRDELVVSYRMSVGGFDPLTGKQYWSCDGIQDYVVPCVVMHDDVAYVLGGRKNQSMAIRLGGSRDVTETHRIWSTNIGANVTSPIYHEGYLYWASDRGIANCLNAATGESVYKERMKTKERVYASIILAGNRLYLTTRENGIFVVNAQPEYTEVAHNTIASDDSLWNATPAVSGDRLLMRTNRFLYCVGQK